MGTRYLIAILCLLSLLDTVSFGFITKARHYSNSEIGLVASSMFGITRMVLTGFFLTERLIFGQFSASVVAFGGVFYLGF